MPGMDGTGPRGEGPLTGGGRGLCADGIARPCGRIGRAGRGYGIRGRGYGIGVYGRFSDDKAALEAQKALLEKRLAEVDARLKGGSATADPE